MKICLFGKYFECFKNLFEGNKRTSSTYLVYRYVKYFGNAKSDAEFGGFYNIL